MKPVTLKFSATLFNVALWIAGLPVIFPPLVSAQDFSTPAPLVYIIDGKLAPKDSPLVPVVALPDGTHEIIGYSESADPVRVTITISRGKPLPVPPGPFPPDPKPLSVFAEEVKAHAAGLPANDRKRMADNCETVVTMIAAGGLVTPQGCVDKLTALNRSLALDKATWTPFILWLSPQLDAKAQTLKQIETCLQDVANGLRAGG